jgi:hypothetical protein
MLVRETLCYKYLLFPYITCKSIRELVLVTNSIYCAVVARSVLSTRILRPRSFFFVIVILLYLMRLDTVNPILMIVGEFIHIDEVYY